MIPAVGEVQGLLPPGERCVGVEPLHGDGSARRFFRIRAQRGTYVLLEGPDRSENEAYVGIARHLAAVGVRVPRVEAVAADRGWILLEDLGDRSLFTALREPGADPEALYAPVLDLLAHAQVHGAADPGAWSGTAAPPYGPDLMVEGEGLYFAREFAVGVLGLEPPDGFTRSLELLARVGASAPGGFFLHRDFQSRNIQLTPQGPALLDFQGARQGPLAYDAAALILDPYAAHPAPLRERFLRAYRDLLARLGADRGWTEDGWFAVGSFRLLQALGAFGKLGARLRKPGFLEHAASALNHLLEHLGERGCSEVPVVVSFVRRCRDEWSRRSARV